MADTPVDFFHGVSGQDASRAAIESVSRAVEDLVPASTPDHLRKDAEDAAGNLARRQPLSPPQLYALEAIIIPNKRPAVLIRNGDYEIAHASWNHLNQPGVKAKIKPAIAAVCRVDLPGNDPPYAGTAFIVGESLLMTNRHVANAFAGGLGRIGLRMCVDTAEVDFLHEWDRDQRSVHPVLGVAMVHPYWDMALIRIGGLPKDHVRLRLMREQPDDMLEREIVVIGYPAADPRNDLQVQNQVFGGKFNVKRLQPGKIGGTGATANTARYVYPSFEHDVSAVLHNASTLGGNSGSVILDIATGDALGLHFAGEYLKFNCGVPAAELARDARVVDAGVGVVGPARGSLAAWEQAWNRAEPPNEEVRPMAPPKPDDAAHQATAVMASVDGEGVVRITIPLEISLRLGQPLAHTLAVSEIPHAVEGKEPKAQLSSSANVTASQGQRRTADPARAPKTFRSPIVSLIQSATDAAARKIATRPAASAPESNLGAEGPAGVNDIDAMRLAAETVGEEVIDGRAGLPAGDVTATEAAGLEGMSKLAYASTCARLLTQLATDRIFGNTAAATALYDSMKTGTCDPVWVDTVDEYAKRYGILGDPSRRVYKTPKQVGNRVIRIDPKARIAVFGDWGSGAAPARQVIKDIRAVAPTILLHLGDIYYSGTPDETMQNFRDIIERTFGDARPPVFTLCGNHDMYSGGEGYFDLIATLNPPETAQNSSFFCLRTTDDAWQILGLDTGRNDFHPLAHKVTFVEPEEEDWLVARVEEFKGKTILASHHPLFSAFSAPGEPDRHGRANPINPNLQRTFDRLVKAGAKVSAWLWGHEHNLCVYQPYADLERGRCIGHGAVPVFVEDEPYKTDPTMVSPPTLVPGSMIASDGHYYAHGFALLELRGDTARIGYLQNVAGRRLEHFSEVIS